MAHQFLEHGVQVLACDKRDRASIGAAADGLEQAGAVLKLGEGYLDNLEAVSYTHLDVYKRQPHTFDIRPSKGQY